MPNHLYLAIACLFVINVPGQGIIEFDNRGLRDPQGNLYVAPVSLPDGSFAEGPRFVGGLFLVQTDSLSLVGTAPFRAGAQAGYLVPTEFQVPGHPQGSTATFRARVWEASAGSYSIPD